MEKFFAIVDDVVVFIKTIIATIQDFIASITDKIDDEESEN